MANMTSKSRLTQEQHEAAMAENRQERDRILVAMHAVEEALGAAAPGREEAWADRVIAKLRQLEETLREHLETANEPDGLFADIMQMDPRFEYRISQLRQQLEQLLRNTEAIRQQLEQPHAEKPDFADVRRRLAWLLDQLRDYRSKETDLIFEAYDVDIGLAD